MKSRRLPILPLLLLLLCAAAAWPWPLPAAWNAARLPVLAFASLWVCRKLPARIWLGGALLLGLIALYAWNPTHLWREGVGLLPREHVPFLPGTADPQGTWTTFGVAVAAFAAFALGYRLPKSQIGWLQGAALAGGAILALVVLVQRLEPNAPRIREYTAIFVNENHFAVLINLLLPVVLVMASRARFRAVQDGRPSSPAGIYLLIAVLMAAAVVACRSRAGVAVMALLVAAHVELARRIVRQYPFAGIPPRAPAKVLAGIAVAAAAAFAVRAFWVEWPRLGVVAQEWAYRSGMVKDALAAWMERPVWGTGPGSFTAVFPYYQSELFAGRTILHAHCEPAQFLMEFGVAGLAVLAVALGLLAVGRGACPPAGADIPPFADVERRAFGFGLSACALHCLIDFPLRIPLIALLAAAWAGVWAGTRPAKAGGDRRA